MPKKNKKGKAGKSDSTPGRFRHYLSIMFVVLSVAVLASLFSYNAADRSWFFNPDGGAPRNWFGPVGATISEALLQFAGMSSFLLGLLLLSLAVITNRERRFESRIVRLAGLALITVSFTALLELIFTRPLTMGGTEIMPGGWIGHLLAGFLGGLVNTVGSWVVLLAALLTGVMMISSFTPGVLAGGTVSVLSGWIRGCGKWCSGLIAAWRERMDRRREEKARKKKAKPAREKRRKASEDNGPTKLGMKRAPQINHGAHRAPAEPEIPHPAFQTPMPPADPPVLEHQPEPPVQPKEPVKINPPKAQPKKKEREGAFKTPPLDLLNMPLPDAGVDEGELVRKSKLLVEKLEEFGVGGTVVRIHPGPVVTTFEFRPDPGIKYSRIVSLGDDLCLALRADSIRIDRMAGRSTVGLEVPNINREIIAIREILDSESFRDTSSRLPLALGKTIDGKIYTADLAAMPHLLIAGATGMGKSVGLNIMISSILYRSTPAEVRFVLIDPKRLELGIYEDIPHLLTPVVTDPKLAGTALKWAVTEMENRYTTLASYGVRNIEQYNSVLRKEARNGPRKPAAAQLEADEDGAVEKLTAIAEKENKPLPYIVVVIDELADLMMMGNSSEVELCIARLAHMARAVGIHLVVATQRPSVDVITGLIKANLPARISFRVSSRIDSRTIIDTGGAEKLLGNGDMLLLPPGSSRLVRIHGAYITEDETNLMVDFLRAQDRPSYELDLEKAEDPLGAGPGGGGESDQDPLYDEAVRIVVKGGQASISHLQRRLKIGYSRAARLIDYMELDGIVGPHEGSKAREILVDADYFDEVDEQEL